MRMEARLLQEARLYASKHPHRVVSADCHNYPSLNWLYRYATWVRGSYATNAPYTVYDGTTNRGTTLVSQRNTPADLTADGSSWAFLLDVEVISGVLRIKLDNNANATIVADAIRIVRID